MERKRRRGSLAGVVTASAWLALVLAAGCQPADETPEAARNETADPEVGTVAETEPSDASHTLFTAVLQTADTATAPAVNGEVSIVASDDVDEPLELIVRGRGLPPGEHGWHVHAGACGSSGAVSIALSETAEEDGITGPLEVNDRGEFEETVEVPELNRTMVGMETHSLHIHQNPGANHGPTVACATI
jgi:Cu/Zn superoxide dismutase